MISILLLVKLHQVYCVVLDGSGSVYDDIDWYLVSIKLVLLGIKWYRVSKGLVCLYILEKVEMPHTPRDNRIKCYCLVSNV